MPDAFRWTDTELTQDGLEIQKKPSKRRIDYYFPEGKTSKDGNIGEFKSGFVMLSIMTGARIVPFVIDGKYKWYLEGDREYTLVSRWHLQKKANHLLQNIWRRKVKDFVR